MRKFLAFALILFIMFPVSVSAQHGQGQIVGYYQTMRHTANPLRNQDLERLTHLVLFQVYPTSDGNLDLRWWGPWRNGWESDQGHPQWVAALANPNGAIRTAQQKGVRILLGIGGGGGATHNFMPVLGNAQNRTRFITNIVNFLNQHNLDGVCLDWEFPRGDAEWIAYMDLLVELRAHSGMQGRRIQIALGGDSPNPQFGNHFNMGATGRARVQRDIWQADAIGLMTYDMMQVTQPVTWRTHADPVGAEAAMNAWVAFGQGQPNFSRERLLIGIATYPNQGTRGDNSATDINRKIDFARNGQFGGAIVWEILPGGQHDAQHVNDNLWNLIWTRNQHHGGWTGDGGNIQIFTVAFNSNGGSEVGSITGIESGATIQRPADPTRSGHDFVGWFNGNTQFNFSTQITQNITLTARWTRSGNWIEAPDLASGNLGNDAWTRVWDEGRNGSSVNITSQGNPLSATWTLGPVPTGNSIPATAWPYVGIAFDQGDWEEADRIVINYSSNEPTYLALAMGDFLYMVELSVGQNITANFTPSSFEWDPFNWSKGSPPAGGLNMANVTGISINALGTNGRPTTLTVNSLMVEGLKTEDNPSIVVPNANNRSRTISGINATVMNGNLNLQLPADVRNASVALYDVRGRLLFERNLQIGEATTNIALPNTIARNQAAILQVRTNSGQSLTKRVLIK
ncbi:MAG: glycosyl hydrolase family 18 protein [Chitinivibrionia bacterium]|nr:glycosyl hydrolase family 18 protein [Chitinivibrionia bacterium]